MEDMYLETCEIAILISFDVVSYRFDLALSSSSSMIKVHLIV